MEHLDHNKLNENACAVFVSMRLGWFSGGVWRVYSMATHQGRPQSLTFKIDLAIVVLVDLVNHKIHFLGRGLNSESIHLRKTCCAKVVKSGGLCCQIGQ